MSNKERVLQLISDIPDNKLVFVIDILESMKAYANETIQPDEWDLQMIEEAQKTNDGTTVPLFSYSQVQIDFPLLQRNF